MVLTSLLYAGRSFILLLLKNISPLSGVIKPPIILRVVVFPHPDGPKNVTNSPDFIFKFKSFKIVSPSKETFMFLRETTKFSSIYSSPFRTLY